MSKNSNSTGKRTSETHELSPQKRVRAAKAKLEELRAAAPPPPTKSAEQHPAAVACEEMGKVRRSIGEVNVPVTLSEICAVVGGVDCHPDRFAVTALECLAGQLGAMVSLAEHEQVDPYNAFRVMDNLVERMRLASRVTAWLESEATELPEVAP